MGAFGPPGASDDALAARARALAGVIAHRGPDADGAWADGAHGIALGHRRLSILDLSPEGAQPMQSVAPGGGAGRYVIAYNGEAYNFADLRRDLAAHGVSFRGGSDTEVLLAAFERYGLRATFERTVGMFACAIWDRATATLTLVRDRFGVKPLYVGESGGVLLFGSELKALRSHPAFDPTLDPDAAGAFLRLAYVPPPRTIYRAVRMLAPGTLLHVRRDAATGRFERREEVYWSAEQAVAEARADPFTGTVAEATDALEAALLDAVGLRMIADVPLGAFLSGGVDSSTVVALMQRLASGPVRTFTIGMPGAQPGTGYDEAPHARDVAAHLGTDHTEAYVSDGDVLDAVRRLPHHFDEPFADASAVPTLLVSEIARRHVTVSLSGDGGDELFGGYNRHIAGARFWQRVQPVPAWARRRSADLLLASATWRGGAAVDRLFDVLPARLRVRTPAQKFAKLARALGATSEADLYERLVSVWPDGVAALRGARPLPRYADPAVAGLSTSERMMLLDALHYLPGDILTKVDRATMAWSLEGREPLLDHRVFSLAWRLPLSMKIRGGTGKWLLREVLYRHVPRTLIERPKMGFALPLGLLLRGPLAGWRADLLAPDRLHADGLLDPVRVQRLHADFERGAPDTDSALWNVLMWLAWRAHHDGTAPVNV